VSAEVERLRAALLRGEVALVPTDTVYGLAAALDSPAGVEALYRLKGRPRSQPCQVLLYSAAALAEALAALEARARTAASALLPGPVTCLVSDPPGRYAAAAGEAPGSVGLRAPRMTGPIAALDLALVATSANHPGQPDPASLAEVPADLRAAATALDAGTLPGTASAVVDLRALGDGGNAVLVRPGPDPGVLASALAAVGVVLSTVYPRRDGHHPGGRAA
jgi:L-threonylcarbamoyladenylate synthase